MKREYQKVIKRITASANPEINIQVERFALPKTGVFLTDNICKFKNI